MLFRTALLCLSIGAFAGALPSDGCCEESAWYVDFDQDGYGDPDAIVLACDAPEGYVGNNLDCDDDNPRVNPEAMEVCDELDNDCDGFVDEEGCDDPYPIRLCSATGGEWTDCGSGCGPITCENPVPGDICPDVCVPLCMCPADTPFWDEEAGCIARDECDIPLPIDEDGDGFPAEQDCDDQDPEVNPRAEEVCDGIDNDCDGSIDENGCEEPSPMRLCSATGGEWTECGSGCGPATCENPMPGQECPDVCVEQCICPEDAYLWDDFAGCIPRSQCDGDEPRRE